MAAIVYHGLQSHLEPQIVESRTIRLRLPSPKPVPSQSIDLAFKTCFWDSNSNSNIKTNQEKNKATPSSSNNNRSWNFLDSLSQETKQQKETTYVHPQQRRSSLALSPKSLEICTENLGNESGTDIVENSIDDMLSSSSSSSSSLGTREQNQRQGYRVLAAKKEKTQNFPPPLTTIRGSESLRVRPHREDGRLVIEVTKVPPSASCFQAERSDGRLRLCFSTNQDTSFDHPQEEDEEEYDNLDENEPTNNEDEEEYDNMDGNEPASNEGFDEEYYDEEIVDDEEEKEEETEQKAEVFEEVVEFDDVRMDKYGRPRRCNEGGDHHRESNELLNWGERLWVANC